MRKAIVIYLAVAFSAFAIKSFLDLRMARRSLEERKHAQQAALQIRERLTAFKDREGELPESLAILNLPSAVTEKFVYSKDANGYSLAYYGTNYSTAKKGWTGP